jgi:hypothetical protein
MGQGMNSASPILRQISCADAKSLQQAYEHVADAAWVDGCTVDLPNLMLEVRVTAPWQVRTALEAQLAQIERIACGKAR